MLETQFLTYPELLERFPALASLGWSAITLNGFVEAGFLLGCPDRVGGGYRYHVGDVALLIGRETGLRKEARG